MSTSRLQAFSDGVFSVAFTLLILDFRLPPDADRLLPYLLGLWPQFIGYCISFLLVGAVWANHRAVFLHIQHADRTLIFLNTLLLANVAFLPFPTALLAKAISSRQGLVVATMFYGGVLTIGGLLFNAIWLHAGYRIRVMHDTATRGHIRRASLGFVVGPIAYFASTLLALVSPYLSISLYAVLIVYSWFPGRSEQPLQRP